MSVTTVVPYMSTGLAGSSVDPGISCGAYKLARISRVIKKKKKFILLAFFLQLANVDQL
jgi:hypothetical protein